MCSFEAGAQPDAVTAKQAVGPAAGKVARKRRRWVVYLLVTLLAVLGGLTVAKNFLAHWFAERQLRRETGLAVSIAELRLSVLSGRLEMDDLKLFNPPEFGGAPLADIGKVTMELDWRRSGFRQLHFRSAYIHVRDLTVIRGKDGRINLEVLQETASKRPRKQSGSSRKMELAIDQLRVSFDEVNYADLRQPARNRRFALDVRDEVGRDIRGREDLKRWATSFFIRLVVREYVMHPESFKGLGLKTQLRRMREAQQE